MDDKLYIKKFVRDDGEILSFDGEEIYLARENTLLVRADPATTAVEYTESDGGEMIRQRNAIYEQPIKGLIVPKFSPYWDLTTKLSLFFRINHSYKIVYVKKDGTMFAMSGAWISSGLQIVPVPHEEYSNWTITMSIGNTAWTEYAEDDSGKEIYSNTVTLPLLSAVTGGEEWEYQEGETISGEGSEIELETGSGATINDIKLYGDTFQQTYSGKNLFGIGSLRSTINGSSSISNGVITLIPTGTGNPIVRLNLIKPLPAGTYTLNSSTYLSTTTQLRDENDSTTIYNFSSNYQNVTFTTTDEATMIRFNFVNPGNTNPIYIDLNTLQIEAGSTATSYEPYVGGTASPNPDYPQDIDVVTGEQTVKVNGKNLFNKNGDTSVGSLNIDGTQNTSATLYTTTEYIRISGGETYTTSGMITGSGVNPSRNYYDANKTFISGKKHNLNNPFTDTAPSNAVYMRDCFQTVDIEAIQIEQASTATSFESYQSQTYAVDLGTIELCKIGTYQDYIYKSGDDWYVHKAIGKANLGDFTWAASGTNIANVYRMKTKGLDGLFVPPPDSNTAGLCFCNYFYSTPNNNSGTVSGVESITFTKNGDDVYCYNTDYNASTSGNDFQTWCGNNNVTLYYALATPTDTKITDADLISELEALAGATGYNELTIITTTSTGTNLPVILAVEMQNLPISGEVWDNVGTVWELGSGGVQTLNIASTQTVYPVWVVNGPCINPKLQNNTTDTNAVFDGTVAEGQTLTVDFAAGTAYLDSAVVTRYVSGLVSFAPGENITGFNSDGGATQESTISWNNIIN